MQVKAGRKSNRRVVAAGGEAVYGTDPQQRDTVRWIGDSKQGGPDGWRDRQDGWNAGRRDDRITAGGFVAVHQTTYRR